MQNGCINSKSAEGLVKVFDQSSSVSKKQFSSVKGSIMGITPDPVTLLLEEIKRWL
jgi:hypothetical protein